jgi:putative nucleotidyltransferase with HDIG domain
VLVSRAVTQWPAGVERSFKEVLYRFLEEVHCTKAALYLESPAGGFVLAARYGFGRGDAPPEFLTAEDPLVVSAADLDGVPLVVNSGADVPRLEERLLASGARRLLLTPLIDRGRLVGLVDARDKGGRQPFSEGDADAAAGISRRLVEVALGQGVIEPPDRAASVEPPEALQDPLPPPPRYRDTPLLDLSALGGMTNAARQAVIQDGAYAVAVTVIHEGHAATVVYGSHEGNPTEEAAFKNHQIEALLRVGSAMPRSADWRLEWRRLAGADDAARPALVVSSVPLTSSSWSFVLSVVGADGGIRSAAILDRLHEALGQQHRLAELRFNRRGLVRRLLEPGEARYPDLMAHSVAVSRLCMRMAVAEGFDEEGVEAAATAGLLHDVGMRELDYDRLYRISDPRPEHHRVYRQHPVVGERILRGVGLEPVADAIRSHHERWDGVGYPDRLSGEEIPWLARLVHTAEVFDVLTSPSSYRSPMPVDRAMSTIEAGAGQQFDPAMVELLVRVVE